MRSSRPDAGDWHASGFWCALARRPCGGCTRSGRGRCALSDTARLLRGSCDLYALVPSCLSAAKNPFADAKLAKLHLYGGSLNAANDDELQRMPVSIDLGVIAQYQMLIDEAARSSYGKRTAPLQGVRGETLMKKILGLSAVLGLLAVVSIAPVAAQTRPENPPGARPENPPGARPENPPGARPENPPGARPENPPGARPENPPGARPENPPGARPENPPGKK